MINCKTCGRDISNYLNGTSDECANCWEVQRRLSDYLKSDIGKAFVENALEEATGRNVFVRIGARNVALTRAEYTSFNAMVRRQ